MNSHIMRGTFVVLLLPFLFACNYNSSLMMKTGKDYDYTSIPVETSKEYVILENDLVEFQLYTNGGNTLIDVTALTQSNEQQRGRNSNGSYLVGADGIARLPIIGKLKLKGKTIRQVESLLQEKYAKYYIDPFVLVSVLNRRVTIFNGGSGSARVIPLKNENVTIIEGIALAGGIDKFSKADKIKLIRGDKKNPEVYLFDFSTIEGAKDADFVLQPNDIIYVEYRINVVNEWIKDISPIISFFSTTVALILVWGNFNN